MDLCVVRENEPQKQSILITSMVKRQCNVMGMGWNNERGQQLSQGECLSTCTSKCIAIEETYRQQLNIAFCFSEYFLGKSSRKHSNFLTTYSRAKFNSTITISVKS